MFILESGEIISCLPTSIFKEGITLIIDTSLVSWSVIAFWQNTPHENLIGSFYEQ